MIELTISFIIAFLCQGTPVDPAFVEELMLRESGGNQFAVGDLDAPTGPSLGYFQFQRDTFDWAYTKRFGHAPDWDADIDPRFNEWDSARVAIWMIENGYAWMWTCGRQLIDEGWPRRRAVALRRTLPMT